MTIPAKPNSFSLVEVVLALGVFSFCVVTLLGVLSASLANTRHSSDDTVLAAMTARMAAFVRDAPTNSVNAITTGTFAFTVQGEPVTALSSPAYYSCTVTSARDPVEANLTNVVLVFRWPMQAVSIHQTVVTNNVTLPPD